MRCAWILCAAAVWAGVPGIVAAQTVTVISPLGDGPDTNNAVAELGLAVDRALARFPRYERVNEAPLLPGEVHAAFGCMEFDEACARRAGEAGGARLVLLPRVVRLEDALEVRLVLVDVAGGAARRELVRFVRLGGDDERVVTAGLAVALGALAEALLDDREPFDAAVVPMATESVAVDGQPVTPGRLVPTAVGRHRLRFGGIPSTELSIELGRHDILVLVPGGEPVGGTESSPRRVAAWMSAGVGAAAFAGAAFTSVRLAGTQNDYDRASTGGRLRELAQQGGNEALATNVLLATGAVAAGVALFFFLTD